MSSSRASEAKLITGLGLSKELTASVSHPQPEAATRVVGQDKANSTVGANRDPIYKCNNCGKRMKLQDAVNYYGIPACPACIRAGAPFEIARETSDSGIVDGQRSTPPTQPKNL